MDTVRKLLALLVPVALGLGVVVGPAAAEPVPGSARNPVLVIGGFDANVGKLETLRAWLGSRGYTAYAMVLPGQPAGTAPLVDSARAVADEVAEIRRETGSARVDLVGHSMGGLAQRHFVKFLDGRAAVGTYVDFGTPENGVVLALLCAPFYPGCRDMSPGSPFLTALNAVPAIPPDLPAYHLFSEDAGEEREPLPGATNASVQSFCPGRPVSHADEPIDGAFQELIDSALRGEPLTTGCP
ncbi:esterase/lipase family protein [Nocardia amikacinitolerans]|uniref:esterase/lipase family protein n=1 Tax=Nocardia amikacinitolerans TaxID=756689 RepID=UPI0020A45E4D|nr:alpha/beta fold hydrolase [Nocardia amikacinitolerans]MCP2288055.1 Alpha/beta hydrolase family protein [Nocardia amikacinitolerans]